jgi:hypothetical protein
MTQTTDRLAWLRENIEYDERNPGTLYPDIILEDGSLRLLSADCPKRRSLSASDLCGVHCPELSALFLPKVSFR